ncbi:ribosomal RNA processing protein 1 homolog [Eupeodes corollae]|uniref:ribosomal RNA processing protein 1 homolog n=1 Tax=Eupeodes corollae TaxID=290404 RepID=UPI002490C187|nr:ribosomal RNA processing protein 1 homolog [Eupeodes corollae]
MISKNPKPKKQDNENTDDIESNEKLPNEVLVIAQEVKIINALASNDLSQRTKQLKKLRRWLTIRSNSSFPFTEEDFLRIWKGLYYMMWMSDKPLVQEELAENLGKLIECFTDIKAGVQFFGAFLRTMCREWFGVDQWRMDKFLMLIRRMMRYMFLFLKKNSWSSAAIKEFNTNIFETILAENTSTGITMHFMDVFFDELAKVSEGELTSKTVGQFVKPFVKFMAQQHDFKILGHCRNRIFHHLLYQSELGREYSDKYNAWKEMGFPTESIDDLEKVEAPSDTEEENNEPKGPTVLDPRAGNVDAFIPLLPIDGKYIIKEIESLIYKEETSLRSRKMLKDILEKYQTYESGKFPLGVQKMFKPNLKSEKPLIMSKVEALENLENDIYSTTRKLKQLNKKKRRKLLASLNFSEADENTYEKLIERSIPKALQQNGANGKKRKSLPSLSWVEEQVENNDVSPSKIQKTDDEVADTPKAKQTNQKKLKRKLQKDEKPTNKQSVVESNKVAPTVRVAEDKKEELKVSEWDEPLADGEIEYFVPSKKNQLKEANKKLADIVPNPFAHLNQTASPKTPKNMLLGKKTKLMAQSAKLEKGKPVSSPYTPQKRVKIMLQKNTMQNPSEYIKQIKSSPNVPFDATKKPSKGLLKPNSMPSPINPFYKKKIGLKLHNETL